MDVNLEGMSYKDFKKYCNDRACDGKWSMLEAMACLDIIDKIDSIKVKGLFSLTNRKKTKKARELAWKSYNFKTIK